jgi:predicted outer membrane lipoprotein
MTRTLARWLAIRALTRGLFIGSIFVTAWLIGLGWGSLKYGVTIWGLPYWAYLLGGLLAAFGVIYITVVLVEQTATDLKTGWRFARVALRRLRAH